MIVAFTLLGTISTSIVLPLLSYAINGTFSSVVTPASGSTNFEISINALTVATYLIVSSEPLIIISV